MFLATIICCFIIILVLKSSSGLEIVFSLGVQDNKVIKYTCPVTKEDKTVHIYYVIDQD